MTHGQTLRAYLDWCDWADLRAGDRYLIANPFFHIFGYKAGCLACLMRGATIFPLAVFDAGRRARDRRAGADLRAPRAADDLPRRCSTIPTATRRDISSLRVGVTGAADIPVELIRRVREELPFERILTGYGLTEAGHRHRLPARRRLRAHRDDRRRRRGRASRCASSTETGRRRRRSGEPGEVVVRGETVTRGYLDDPEATAAAIDADGWLHTGDLGTIDADGYLRIVGRIKDMFIVGGFNAYPAEIENLMLRHPRIAQVAVIGVPDERLGEVGKAFVVLAARSAGRRRRRSSSGRAREMANFKAPRSVEFLDALPVNATGKVVKDELRASGVVTDDADGQVPVAEGIFTWPSDEPQLIGSRCTACGIVTFPAQDSCPRCASTEMAEHLLARRGRLWAWTTQDFPPPSPPYTGPTGTRLRAVRRRLRRAAR